LLLKKLGYTLPKSNDHQRTNYDETLRPIAATYLTKVFNSITIHNLPAARARKVFKPSQWRT